MNWLKMIKRNLKIINLKKEEMKLKNLRKALKSRITDNEGLQGMITLFLLVKGWEHMMEKDGLWFWGLIIFSVGFFSCIPIALKLIDGKGLKK